MDTSEVEYKRIAWCMTIGGIIIFSAYLDIGYVVGGTFLFAGTIGTIIKAIIG